MKKSFVILATLLFVASVAINAQVSNFRVSYGHYATADQMFNFPNVNGEVVRGGSLIMEADVLNFGENFTFGAYLGGGLFDYDEATETGNQNIDVKTKMDVRLGINLRCHLLSLANVDAKHWDVALGVTLGSHFYMRSTPMTERGISLGATYYPTDHFGIFVENAWGVFTFVPSDLDRRDHWLNGANQTKIGLSYRF